MSSNIVVTCSDSDEDTDFNDIRDSSKWCLIPGNKSENTIVVTKVSNYFFFHTDHVFLQICNQLSTTDILRASQCCRRWNVLAKDDFLWKKLFQRDFKVEKNINIKQGK